MHIQKIFVILAFNNQLMETVISLLVQIPVVGNKLEAPVRALLGTVPLSPYMVRPQCTVGDDLTAKNLNLYITNFEQTGLHIHLAARVGDHLTPKSA